MNLKLKRIAPLQAGKLLAIFYGLFSLVFLPFMFVAMTVGSLAGRHQGGPTPGFPLLMGLGIGFVVFLPVIYALMGFVFGAIAAWVYNLVARWVGGFELEFEAAVPPVEPGAAGGS